MGGSVDSVGDLSGSWYLEIFRVTSVKLRGTNVYWFVALKRLDGDETCTIGVGKFKSVVRSTFPVIFGVLTG